MVTAAVGRSTTRLTAAAASLTLELDTSLAEGTAYVPANLDDTWVLGVPDVVTVAAATGAADEGADDSGDEAGEDAE